MSAYSPLRSSQGLAGKSYPAAPVFHHELEINYLSFFLEIKIIQFIVLVLGLSGISMSLHREDSNNWEITFVL